MGQDRPIKFSERRSPDLFLLGVQLRGRSVAQLICEISEGLRPSEATVMVTDAQNLRHFLPVDRDLLTSENGRSYLPVGLVHLDETKKLALIELPVEADSGTSRIWVKQKQLVLSETVP
jgi:hypothetical protein